jgi:hypothetical protein
MAGVAQDKPQDSLAHKHADKSADASKDLAVQLADLRAKVAKLEAALKKSQPGMSGMGAMQGKGMGPMGQGGMQGMGAQKQGMSGMAGQGMGGMMGMDGMMMAGMGGQKQGAAGMGGQGMASMGMMEDDGMEMMGMMGLGSMGQAGMKGMGKMKTASGLPGFPGASHIYHIGATGFFLDHPEHIALTTEQQTALNRFKQKALLEKSSSQRKIDEAEQELWTLTSSDRPDAATIEAKVREIEKLRGDQRLTFIRTVGEAAKVLTDDQRKTLLGMSDNKANKAPAHAGH